MSVTIGQNISKMAEKRIFAALDISDEARERAVKHILRLAADAPGGGIIWEKPEKLHFTLRFLGSVSEDVRLAVGKALSAAAASFSTFEADLGGQGVFPGISRPRIFWVGLVHGGERMTDLALKVDQNLESAGIRPDDKPFVPHLTIARVREQRLGSELVRRHLDAALEPVRFEVNAITLYESTLRPTGSTYSVLERYPLGG